jgi:hypothetical protein
MRERAQRSTENEAFETAQHSTEVESESHDRYVAGEIPPVADVEEEGFDRAESASELAYGDDREEELKRKVEALVKKNHEGDYKKAFDFYDHDKDGGVVKSELIQLLEDAEVGNKLTRGTWAKMIIEKLDRDQDTKIQWTEFEQVFTAQA